MQMISNRFRGPREKLQKWLAAGHPQIKQEKDKWFWVGEEGDHYEIVPEEECHALLQRLYADPKLGMTGRDRFHYKLDKLYANISKTQVMEFLEQQKGHHMTQDWKKQPIVRPVYANGPHIKWQMDLVDFQELSTLPGNHGANWMLTVVNVFSKYV